MTYMRCLVNNCRSTSSSVGPGVTFHSCPSSREMRNKWLLALKNKSSMIDWSRSKICSKHFLNKCFDSARRLKDDAVPTLLHTPIRKEIMVRPKTTLEAMLSKKSATEILYNINTSMVKLKEPANINELCHENLQPKSDLTIEEQLWLVVKKQEYLIKQTMSRAAEDSKHMTALESSVDSLRAWKKKREENIQSYKYIVKCLQEKHATLEEQIEILSTVESR